jgi:hypothetical protein
MREEIELLRRERDALLAERDALVSDPDPAGRASAMLRRHPSNIPALAPDSGWGPRIVAVAFLLACLIALAIITHVL